MPPILRGHGLVSGKAFLILASYLATPVLGTAITEVISMAAAGTSTTEIRKGAAPPALESVEGEKHSRTTFVAVWQTFLVFYFRLT